MHQPRRASKLRSASAHWLRHSYVTYLLDSDAPLKVAQKNAGHSDIGTTMLVRWIVLKQLVKNQEVSIEW
jgi:site-specific recombinase XerD